MHIGQYISGAAHAGLIGWVLVGGVFDSDPPPMEVVDVAMISSAEFEALTQGQQAPETATEVALPQPPTEAEPAPALNSEPDQSVLQDTPPEVPQAAPEDAPDVTEVTPPAPIVPDDVADEPPQLPTPEVETAVVIPNSSIRPVARPADRVAPEPVAQPAPDVTIADELQEATQPADSPSDVEEETKEETAPEAASTEIATEPKQEEAASTGLTRSLRPRARPAGLKAPTPGAAEDAIAAALAEASAAEVADTPSAPSGPPLTRGEKDGLRVAVQQCWVVDVGSRAADVTVVVGFSLNQDGKVQGDIKLLSAEGGDQTAAQTAFQAARRAVLRCQKSGYDLPVEKYDHWRDVEITFNPESMRSR